MLINEKLHRRIVEKWKAIDSYRPFPPEIMRKLRESFKIEYTYNTNAIEGNTLTLRETQFVIEEGQTVRGKSLRELYEVKNHPEAIEYVEKLASEHRELRETDIFTLHQIIMKETTDPKYIGTYRKGRIKIAGSKHTPPPAYEVPELIRELIYTVNRNPDEYVAVELVARVLHRLVYIHPFQDGNGRIARLLANLVLIKKHYPPIIISNSDRKRYFNYLAEADKGRYKLLANFVAQYVDKHLDIYLEALEQVSGDRKISLKEAANISPYSSTYLRLLANRALIPATKDGRNWVIQENDLLAYIRTHKKKSRDLSSTA
ncbi:MAG: Fic family protein [Nitrososphaerales archaeon]